jgi:hypothetical protein
MSSLTHRALTLMDLMYAQKRQGRVRGLSKEID